MYFPQFGAGMLGPRPDNKQVGQTAATQKTGGQVSIADMFRGIGQDVATGARQYTQARIYNELYKAGVPGYEIDPIAPPDQRPIGNFGPNPVATNSAEGGLALAAVAGIAAAFLI